MSEYMHCVPVVAYVVLKKRLNFSFFLTLKLLTLFVQGAQFARNFFTWLFHHEKRGFEFRYFLIHWKLSENEKKMFFQSVLGWSRRCSHSSCIPKPRTFRINHSKKRTLCLLFLENFKKVGGVMSCYVFLPH